MRPVDLSEKNLQMRHQPVQFQRIDGPHSGIGLTESGMGPPEEHLSPDHANQGPVSQNIFGILRIHPADHGDTAGHEFTKIIPGRSQNPELRRIETGIVFGHGHSPGPDVAGDKHLALCHAVCSAVSGMAMNHDMRPGIEPSHIIRCRAGHLDFCVGKPK